MDADWMAVRNFVRSSPRNKTKKGAAKHPRRISLRRLARIELLPSEMIYIPRILGASLTHFSESQGARLFPLHPRHLIHRTASPSTPTASDPISPTLFLRLPWNLRRSFARVTRFRETEIVLSRKSFPLSSHTTNHRLR